MDKTGFHGNRTVKKGVFGANARPMVRPSRPASSQRFKKDNSQRRSLQPSSSSKFSVPKRPHSNSIEDKSPKVARLPLFLEKNPMAALRVPPKPLNPQTRGIDLKSQLFNYDVVSSRHNIDEELEDAMTSLPGGSNELYMKLKSFDAFDEEFKNVLLNAWIFDVLAVREGQCEHPGTAVAFANRFPEPYKTQVRCVFKDLVTRYFERLKPVVKDRLLRMMDESFIVFTDLGSELMLPLMRHMRSGDMSDSNFHLISHVVHIFTRHYEALKHKPLCLAFCLYTFTAFVNEHSVARALLEESASGDAQIEFPFPPPKDLPKVVSLKMITTLLEREVRLCAKVLADDFKVIRLIGRDFVRLLLPVLKLSVFNRFWSQFINIKDTNGKPLVQAILSIPTDPFFLINRIPPAIERHLFFVCSELRNHDHLKQYADFIDSYIKRIPGQIGDYLRIDIVRYLSCVVGYTSTVSHLRNNLIMFKYPCQQLLSGSINVSKCPLLTFQLRLAAFFDLILPLGQPTLFHLAGIECAISLIGHMPALSTNGKAPFGCVDFITNLPDIYAPLRKWFRSNFARNLEFLFIGKTEDPVFLLMRSRAIFALVQMFGDSLSSGYWTGGFLTAKDRVLRNKLLTMMPITVVCQFCLDRDWQRKRTPITLATPPRTEPSARKRKIDQTIRPPPPPFPSVVHQTPADVTNKVKSTGLIELSDTITSQIKANQATTYETIAKHFLVFVQTAKNEKKLEESVELIQKYIVSGLATFRIQPINELLWSKNNCAKIRSETIDNQTLFVPLVEIAGSNDSGTQELLTDVIRLIYEKDQKYTIAIMVAMSVLSSSNRRLIFEKIFHGIQHSASLSSLIKDHFLKISDWQGSTFVFLVPFFMTNYQQLRGDFDIITRICSELFGQRLSVFTKSTVFNEFSIFSRSNICECVMRSVELKSDNFAWEAFWQLLGCSSHKVPLSTFAEVFSQSSNDSDIDYQLAILLRAQLMPTESLVDCILRRKPDKFTNLVVEGWCLAQTKSGNKLDQLAQVFIATAIAKQNDQGLVAHVRPVKELMKCKNLVNYIDSVLEKKTTTPKRAVRNSP